MIPELSDRARTLLERAERFVAERVIPAEGDYASEVAAERWAVPAVMEELKAEARSRGLWNLFLPADAGGLGNRDYAPIAELTGRSPLAPEAMNCSAPDSGNTELLLRYGTPEQKRRWLEPLLEGRIRSAFLMSEPDVASSDAARVRCSIRSDGDALVVDGRKWWSSGAGDPRCALYVVMGVSDPDAEHPRRHAMVLVPADAAGVQVRRALPIFGYDDAPHGHMEIALDGVRVPATSLVLGPGRGFEIAQGRLGPARLHHCMRSVGTAERALGLMVERLKARRPFGEPLSERSLWQDRVAAARCRIDQARLLCLATAHKLDVEGNRAARKEIAMIKFVAPRAALAVIDDAIQAFGGAGVSNDLPLAWFHAQQRCLRIADGPDEVHGRTIARLEIGR